MGVVKLDGVAGEGDAGLVRWLAQTAATARAANPAGRYYRQALLDGLLHRGGGLTRNGRLLVAGFEAARAEIERQRRQLEKLRRVQRGLTRRAYHDALTGLPNRLLGADRLALGLHRARRGGGGLALFYLDLDEFKSVNDRYGHNCGDQLLRSVARRLAGCARRSDTVARFGGDEFVLIVEGLSQPSAVVAVANKLRRALADPVFCGAQRLSVGVSIGIAVYEDGLEVATLLERADRAMYWIKARGGGCAVAAAGDAEEIAAQLD